MVSDFWSLKVVAMGLATLGGLHFLIRRFRSHHRLGDDHHCDEGNLTRESLIRNESDETGRNNVDLMEEDIVGEEVPEQLMYAPGTPPHERDEPFQMEDRVDSNRIGGFEGNSGFILDTSDRYSEIEDEEARDDDEESLRPRSPVRYESMEGASGTHVLSAQDFVGVAENENLMNTVSEVPDIVGPSITLFSNYVPEGVVEELDTSESVKMLTAEKESADIANISESLSKGELCNKPETSSPPSSMKSSIDGHDTNGNTHISNIGDSPKTTPENVMQEDIVALQPAKDNIAENVARKGPKVVRRGTTRNTLVSDEFKNLLPETWEETPFTRINHSPESHFTLAESKQNRGNHAYTLAESLKGIQRDVSFDAWSNVNLRPDMERSATLKSAASERRMASLDIESEDTSVIASEDPTAPLIVQIDVISGPSSRKSYVNRDSATEIIVGRGTGADFVIYDPEVSSRHIQLSWNTKNKCWQVCDLGSLNGTLLNRELIGGGSMGRGCGEEFRLSADDVLQLGSSTQIKISVFPREMLPENFLERHSLSLSVGGSLPRTLTMPKHRIPSFSSLLSPKITSNSPSRRAVVAAASDELRMECCIAFAVGKDHLWKNQRCEDVAMAECPLRDSEAVLEGSPAALFCVFDGHGGRNTAETACTVLPEEVSNRLAIICKKSKSISPRSASSVDGLFESVAEDVLSSTLSDISKPESSQLAFRDAFLATDDKIESEEGCTATAVIAWQGDKHEVRLLAANVGDSAALLIDVDKGPESCLTLTEDHRLTNPKERERLESSGIPLTGSTHRLYGLNLARALGDRFLKDEDLGLIAEPYVGEAISVPKNRGALLLIASDGLWDVLDQERVAALLCSADKENDGSVVEVASAVIEAAQKANTRDDVTALVIRIFPIDEWALRSPIYDFMDENEKRKIV